MNPGLLRAIKLRQALGVGAGALALGVLVVKFEAAIALIVPGVLGTIILVTLVRAMVQWPEDPSAHERILRWTIMAFFAHLLFGLAVTSSQTAVAYLGGDAVAYHNIGKELARHWLDGFPAAPLPQGKEGFYFVVAVLYRVFGAHPAAGIAFNATCGAALVPIVSDTTRRLFGAAAARFVPPLMVLLPGFFIFTSQLLKEAAILLLIALIANYASRMVERFSLGPMIVVPCSLALLFTFRAWVALAIASALVLAIAVGTRALLSGVSTGLGTAAIVAAIIVASGLGYSGYKTATKSDLKQAQLVRLDLATSASTGFAADADISSPTQAFSFLPKGLVIFYLGPFPWQLRGARQLAVFPDALAWWILLPTFWRGLRRGSALIGRRLAVLVLPALATSVLLALAIGNYGTMVRERMQVVVLLVPIIALGLSMRKGGTSSHAEPEHVAASAR